MPVNIRGLASYWPALLKVGCIVLLILAGNMAAGWIVEALNFDIRPSNEDLVHQTIVISAIVYLLLIAVPFVPGFEVGFALIGVLGPSIVFLVYVCTLMGLTLSFLIGRWVPVKFLIALFDCLKLHKLSGLLKTIAPISIEERLAFLVSKAPNRIVPLLLRHRYITLAVIVNIPGNALIGGGGGIALMAGISRLYSVPGFLIAIAIAVAPLPLAIFLFGDDVLPRLIAQVTNNRVLAIASI